MDAIATVARGTLTQDDIKAFRQADRVSFGFLPASGGFIWATKTVRHAGPFDDRERRHEIPVGSEFCGKHANGEPASEHNSRCSDMLHSTSGVWATVAAFVKPGDELALEWFADAGRNGYLENAVVADGHGKGEKLHADTLTLVVRRKGKRFEFPIRESICPDNTARMVKRV